MWPKCVYVCMCVFVYVCMWQCSSVCWIHSSIRIRKGLQMWNDAMCAARVNFSRYTTYYWIILLLLVLWKQPNAQCSAQTVPVTFQNAVRQTKEPGSVNIEALHKHTSNPLSHTKPPVEWTWGFSFSRGDGHFLDYPKPVFRGGAITWKRGHCFIIWFFSNAYYRNPQLRVDNNG